MDSNEKRLCIAIPASVVSDTPHLREKTSKIGLIGRTAAIFRAAEIIIYPDNPKADQTAEMDFVMTLLSYMETPQYLRKRLFKIKPELRYAGVLPPLRTPHHPLGRRAEDLQIGEHREGVTLSQTKDGTLVDVGVEQPVLVLKKRLSTGKRITVKITNVEGRIEAELANREEIQAYWGYKVNVEKVSFGDLLKKWNFDLIIATSKHGVPMPKVAEKIASDWRKAHAILVVFGAPTKGLYEIAGQESLDLEDAADFVVNTIPLQGTETVRTEEALLASLAILTFNSHVYA